MDDEPIIGIQFPSFFNNVPATPIFMETFEAFLFMSSSILISWKLSSFSFFFSQEANKIKFRKHIKHKAFMSFCYFQGLSINLIAKLLILVIKPSVNDNQLLHRGFDYFFALLNKLSRSCGPYNTELRTLFCKAGGLQRRHSLR